MAFGDAPLRETAAMPPPPPGLAASLPIPSVSGRTTPREARLSGNHAPTNNFFRSSLRPDGGSKDRRRRSHSFGARGSRREEMARGEGYSKAADRAAEKDADWRCGSYRYCNSMFYDTLRSWDGGDELDVRHRTPPDWRVSTEDNLGLGGTAFGHDLSNNDAQGWRRSSSVWVEKQFRSGMRDYKGQDVAFNEDGTRRAQSKIVGDVSSGQGASIYRSKVQANVMSTARADECFLGSLRSTGTVDADEYQRRRRRNLNLPQYKELPREDVAKAKRLFAQIDMDASGSIDADELRAFLKSIGHSEKSKAVQELIKQADEGAKDCKLQIREFCRLYHGLKL